MNQLKTGTKYKNAKKAILKLEKCIDYVGKRRGKTTCLIFKKEK